MFDILSGGGSTKDSKTRGKKKKKGKDHLEDPLSAKATVMGSAEDTEYAFDDSFTPALVDKLKDKKVSLDDALHGMSDKSLGGTSTNDDGLHHPTIVSFGKERAAKGKRKAQKRAVLVANQRYKHISRLETPVAEAATLAGSLKGRGYKTKNYNNRTAKSMKARYEAMVSKAQEGDQLVAYYAGHGAEDGLVGIKYSSTKNDMMSYGDVSGIVSQATSKGANIRFIMDSCHSGTGAQLVRSQQINKLAEEGETMTAKVVSLALSALQDNRKQLMDHTTARSEAIDEAKQALRDHQAMAPADDDSDEIWDEWLDQEEALEKNIEKVERKMDRKAKKMWKTMYDGMAYVAQFAGLDAPPKDVTDFRTLGAQLKAVDALSNNLLKWGQDTEAEEAEAKK